MMDLEFLGVKPCRTEETIEKQFSKCREELCELGAAIAAYSKRENPKKRAEIAFEGMDTITAIVSLLTMLFNSAEIKNAVDYTNAKNYVRGYRR